MTSDGDVLFFNSCFDNAPYHIGNAYSGSFTFTFSNPVAGVSLDFDTFDFDNVDDPPAGVEVVTLEINGAPYPLTDAGLPSLCNSTQTVLTPSGGFNPQLVQ
ncbi:MAG: hypothetical protein ACKVT2_16250 [Saprospiraceae bacterium]